MNEGAKLIADSLLGLDYKLIAVNGKPYRVNPPTIKTICRAVSHFAKIDLPQTGLTVEALAEVPQTAEEIIEGLACFFDEEIRDQLYACSPGKLLEIMQDIVSLMSPDDFFGCAALARNVARMAAIPRS